LGEAIRLTEDQKKKLLDYLDVELSAATTHVYDPMMKKYETLNNLYYGEVPSRKASWMSNFPILMGATFTDAVTARLLNTTFAYKPTFSLEPTRNSDWSNVTRKVENLIEFKVKTEMNLYKEMRKVLFECTRLGTGAMLTPWVTQTERMTTRYLFWSRSMNIPVVDGIVVRALPMRDLVYPAGYSELRDLPWWTRKMRWTRMMLEVEKAKGNYEVSNKLLKAEQPVDEKQREAQERAGEEPDEVNRILGNEFYLWYDLKGNGEYRRYIATVHLDTKEVLRFEDDTYPRWALTLFRYGPRDYGINGLGVMEMTQPYDEALYALYNTLVDNFKIATMQCFKASKSSNITAKTKIYPAKIFQLDNPETDLMPMAMGQPFNLNPAFIRLIQELGERRAGISDYALGRESPIVGGRATATGTLALIQEGQRRFDLTIRDVREQMDDFGDFHLRMIHSRMNRRVPYMIMGEDGRWVEEFLKMPAMPPYLALSVKSSMSHVAQNKEVEKNDAMATFQLLERYYQGVVNLTGLLPQMPDPAMQQVVLKILKASGEKVKKVLETYGEMTPEEYTGVAESLTGGAEPPPVVPPEEEVPVG